MRTKRLFSIFLAVFIIVITKTQAQNYQISFGGSGASTTVDNVVVSNITQGTSLTLGGSEILNLVNTATGIKTSTITEKTLQIYPNPVTTDCNVQFEIENAGVAKLDIFDITGRKVSSSKNNLTVGTHTLNISGLNNGIYTLSLSTADESYSGKIISKSNTKGNPTISYLNTTEGITNRAKVSSISVVNMDYTDGDRLLIKGTSGNYSTLISIIPTASSTQTFNFVAATDYDGNNYTTVTIGSQVWMIENLRTTTYNDGTPIPKVTDGTAWSTLTTGAYCNYNNDDSNVSKYGMLYNWYAVNTGKLALEGWKIPIADDWQILRNYLIVNGYNYDGTTSGNKVAKSLASTTTDWNSSTDEGTTGKDVSLNNSTGFSALPGGDRYGNAMFDGLGEYGVWWCSNGDGDSSNLAFYFMLHYLAKDFYQCEDEKTYGIAVRCVMYLY